MSVIDVFSAGGYNTELLARTVGVEGPGDRVQQPGLCGLRREGHRRALRERATRQRAPGDRRSRPARPRPGVARRGPVRHELPRCLLASEGRLVRQDRSPRNCWRDCSRRSSPAGSSSCRITWPIPAAIRSRTPKFTASIRPASNGISQQAGFVFDGVERRARAPGGRPHEDRVRRVGPRQDRSVRLPLPQARRLRCRARGSGRACRDGVMTERSQEGVLRLAMWSGPRNISTAFMRSWGNRDRHRRRRRAVLCPLPARDRPRPPRSRRDHRAPPIRLAPRGRHAARAFAAGIRIQYQKQMSHHLLPDMGREWLDAMTHAFLIREPRSMVASLGDKLGTFDLLATGLPQQVEIFEHVVQRTGRAPPVVDADELLQRPEPMLRALCAALGRAVFRAHAVRGRSAGARPTASGQDTGTTVSSSRPDSSRRRRPPSRSRCRSRAGGDRSAVPAFVRAPAAIPPARLR